MALAYSTTLRNTMLDAIDDAVNAGAGAGLLRIYDGSRPATGGAATTLLAELTFSDPAFGAASSGTLTASTITQDSSANDVRYACDLVNYALALLTRRYELLRNNDKLLQRHEPDCVIQALLSRKRR